MAIQRYGRASLKVRLGEEMAVAVTVARREGMRSRGSKDLKREDPSAGAVCERVSVIVLGSRNMKGDAWTGQKHGDEYRLTKNGTIETVSLRKFSGIKEAQSDSSKMVWSLMDPAGGSPTHSPDTFMEGVWPPNLASAYYLVSKVRK